MNEIIFFVVFVALSLLARRSLSKDALFMRTSDRWKNAKRPARISWIAATAFLCVVRSEAASITVNGPANLQADLLSLSTATYNATVTASTFFPGSYTINLISKKPVVITGPVACTLDESIKEIKAITLQTYPYGWGNGVAYERSSNLGFIGEAWSMCSSTDTCQSGLSQVSNRIYQQNLSTPTVVPGF